MAEFCDLCGTELGLLTKTTIDRSEGTSVTVCRSCAEERTGPPSRRASRPFGELATPPPPAPKHAKRPEAAPSPRSRVALVMLVSAVVAAVGAFLLVRGGDDERVAPAGAVAPEQPTDHEAPVRAAKTPPPGPSKTAQARADAWRGDVGLSCSGRDQLTLENKRAKVDGVVIDARDDCVITLVDCELSGSSAIVARNRAVVHVRGGSYGGSSRETIRATDSSAVTIAKAKITGVEIGVRGLDQSVLTLNDVTIERNEPSSPRAMPWPKGIAVGGDAELAMRGGSIRWVRHGIEAEKSALVVLRAVKIQADPHSGQLGSGEAVALHLDDGAMALVVAGELSGKRAVLADGSADLTLLGVALVGPATAESNATVTKGDADSLGDLSLAQLRQKLHDQAAAHKVEYEQNQRYGRQACDGVIACYTAHDVTGQVSGQLAMKVNESGEVVSTLVGPGALPAVTQCLRNLGKGRSIADFQGPKGELTCKYTATLMPGGQTLSMSADFVRHRP